MNSRYIQRGWEEFEENTLRGTSTVQRTEMRKAWFCGVAWLLDWQLKILEPGKEATDNDLAKMDVISFELKAFVREMEATPLLR